MLNLSLHPESIPMSERPSLDVICPLSGPTPESIAAAIEARNQEREEAIRAAAAMGWTLCFDTDGRPYLAEPDDAGQN